MYDREKVVISMIYATSDAFYVICLFVYLYICYYSFMSCPSCQQTLQVVTLDNQFVLHCLNCSGVLFAENGINRISLNSAKQLSSSFLPQSPQSPQNPQTPKSPLLCPRDGDAFYAVTNEEAIPQDVALFRCGHCRGIFIYSDDLIRFKHAQGAKLNYFKFWNIAPSSIKSVAVLIFIGVVSLSIFSNYLFFQKNSLTASRADEVIKNISISKYERYLFITFRTPIPLKSLIIFYDKSKKQRFEKIVSSEPKTIHTLTTTDLGLENEIYYQIIGVDEKEKEVRTTERKLMVK